VGNKERSKKFREENPEKSAAYSKKYREKNPDRYKEIREKWEAENEEHLKTYRQQYNQEHALRLKASSILFRFRKSGFLRNLTPEMFEIIKTIKTVTPAEAEGIERFVTYPQKMSEKEEIEYVYPWRDKKRQ
jgi:hypothetical protein